MSSFCIKSQELVQELRDLGNDSWAARKAAATVLAISLVVMSYAAAKMMFGSKVSLNKVFENPAAIAFAVATVLFLVSVFVLKSTACRKERDDLGLSSSESAIIYRYYKDSVSSCKDNEQVGARIKHYDWNENPVAADDNNSEEREETLRSVHLSVTRRINDAFSPLGCISTASFMALAFIAGSYPTLSDLFSKIAPAISTSAKGTTRIAYICIAAALATSLAALIGCAIKGGLFSSHAKNSMLIVISGDVRGDEISDALKYMKKPTTEFDTLVSLHVSGSGIVESFPVRIA